MTNATTPPGFPRTLLASVVAVAAVVATSCSAGEEGPSPGSYTIGFPSTAAAVATDTVQLLVFDLPKSPADRAGFCQTLIQARKRKDPQKPVSTNSPVNICELLLGRKPITIDYGERAILAVAQRPSVDKQTEVDFMSGCVIQTIGNGNAPLPIPVSLVDVGMAVPDTTCSSVGDFCARKCPAQ